MDKKAEKYALIFDKLKAHYGFPQWRQHLNPVDELVSTILSQSTSDINRDKGFYALKERYPDWESVIQAPEDEVIDTIRSAGLANQKGPRIQGALRFIEEQQGSITLDFLDDLPLNEAKDWLTQIKGIGPKTAAIILLFAFGRPAFPVDTHVFRVTGRLGLIEPGTTANKAHDVLEKMGNPDTFYAMHLDLIRHGREICVARKPKCKLCFLQEECDAYPAVLGDGAF